MLNFLAAVHATGVKAIPAFPAGVTAIARWDAADTTTITLSGSNVTTWADKSGNGYNLTQATTAAQPTSGASLLNGFNVIDFNEQYLAQDTAANWKFLNDGTKYVVCAVVKPFTTASPNDYEWLLNTDAASSANAGATIFFDSQTGANKIIHAVYRAASGTNAVYNETATSYYTNNSWMNFSLLADPSNATAANRSYIYKGTSSATQNNASTNAVSTANPGSGLFVGSYKNDVTADRFIGSMAEIVILSGANATDANRITVRDYLSSKWGV